MRENYKVSVVAMKTPRGRRFIVGFNPSPVMRWHDVVNARSMVLDAIRSTAGMTNRSEEIARKVHACIREWSKHGILFPTTYNDGDDFIALYPWSPEEEAATAQFAGNAA